MLSSVFLVCGLRIRDDLNVDGCSCCSWPAGYPGRPRCEGVPADYCHLKQTVLGRRKEFLASVKTLGDSVLDEAPGLTRIYRDLESAHGLGLLRMVGSAPGDFGDVVIFWEVPERWAILTRDRSFQLMKKHRSEIRVFRIRAMRYEVSDEPVDVVYRSQTFSGLLKNYSVTGALIESSIRGAKKNSKVEVRSPTLGIKRGVIMRTDASQSASRWGVYFPGKIR